MPDGGEVQRAIQQAVLAWIDRLDMGRWDITVLFEVDIEDHSEASCDAQPEYERLTLKFDPAQIPLAQVDRYVAHELLHGPTWALMHCASTMARTKSEQEWVRRESEALVTRLEKVVCRMAGCGPPTI